MSFDYTEHAFVPYKARLYTPIKHAFIYLKRIPFYGRKVSSLSSKALLSSVERIALLKREHCFLYAEAFLLSDESITPNQSYTAT